MNPSAVILISAMYVTKAYPHEKPSGKAAVGGEEKRQAFIADDARFFRFISVPWNREQGFNAVSVQIITQT